MLSFSCLFVLPNVAVSFSIVIIYAFNYFDAHLISVLQVGADLLIWNWTIMPNKHFKIIMSFFLIFVYIYIYVCLCVYVYVCVYLCVCIVFFWTCLFFEFSEFSKIIRKIPVSLILQERLSNFQYMGRGGVNIRRCAN